MAGRLQQYHDSTEHKSSVMACLSAACPPHQPQHHTPLGFHHCKMHPMMITAVMAHVTCSAACCCGDYGRNHALHCAMHSAAGKFLRKDTWYSAVAECGIHVAHCLLRAQACFA